MAWAPPRALQAGIPQIISPVSFDQPDNGHRVEVLGAGRVLARQTLSGAALACAARQLFGDPPLGERLASYRVALTPAQGVEHAADFQEHVARDAPLLRAADSASELRRAG